MHVYSEEEDNGCMQRIWAASFRWLSTATAIRPAFSLLDQILLEAGSRDTYLRSVQQGGRGPLRRRHIFVVTRFISRVGERTNYMVVDWMYVGHDMTQVQSEGSLVERTTRGVLLISLSLTGERQPTHVSVWLDPRVDGPSLPQADSPSAGAVRLCSRASRQLPPLRRNNPLDRLSQCR